MSKPIGTGEEAQCWKAYPHEIILRALPVAVLVKLHGCEHVFLPVQPCTACPVHTATCSACMAKRRALHGVLAVEPLARTWHYDGPALDGQFINVQRCQLPLAHTKVLPLYSMQGMTATPGLVARWVMPPHVSSYITRLICYVALSRVPSLDQLVSIGLSETSR